jgi:hypothetical protein
MPKLTKSKLDTLGRAHKTSISALNALVALAHNNTTELVIETPPEHTTVVSSVVPVTLSTADVSKLTVEIANNSTATLYIKKGTGVSVTSYTYKLFPDDLLIVDDYVGELTGIWSAAIGDAQVTETKY